MLRFENSVWGALRNHRELRTQMGMANRKNGDPTQQWKLLEGFSNSRGQID